MVKSFFDLIADFAIRVGVFGNGLELHSFLMGALLPYACLGIAMFDKRVAALVFGISILVGYGIVPEIPITSVIEQKPWYFVLGSCASSMFVYTVVIKRSKWIKIFLSR